MPGQAQSKVQMLSSYMPVPKVHLFENHVGELCQMLCLQLAMRAVLVPHCSPASTELRLK